MIFRATSVSLHSNQDAPCARKVGVVARGLMGAVRAYQLVLRPLIGAQCRFEPHCSAYAIQALRAHGAWRGLRLSVWRVMRCNPWCACGHDPVPPHTQTPSGPQGGPIPRMAR